MVTIPPTPFRKNRGRGKQSATPVAPPVVGPVLVQAIYPVVDVIGAIDLVFDREINISAASMGRRLS